MDTEDYFINEENKEYKEPLCRKVYDSDIVLWNSDWLNGRLKNIINSTPIINEEILEKLNPVIEVREIDLFGDRY